MERPYSDCRCYLDICWRDGAKSQIMWVKVDDLPSRELNTGPSEHVAELKSNIWPCCLLGTSIIENCIITIIIIIIIIIIGCEVLTAVVINVAVFWDTAPCSPYVKRRFGGTYHHHSAHPPATRWFLARLIFDLEDGGDKFLRNVSLHADYTALYPTRWHYLLLFLSLSLHVNKL
jgi:hypothetical protein